MEIVYKIVGYQKRFLECNKHCVDYGEWSIWESCDYINYKDINELIRKGYTYDTRVLYTEANIHPLKEHPLRDEVIKRINSGDITFS